MRFAGFSFLMLGAGSLQGNQAVPDGLQRYQYDVPQLHEIVLSSAGFTCCCRFGRERAMSSWCAIHPESFLPRSDVGAAHV